MEWLSFSRTQKITQRRNQMKIFFFFSRAEGMRQEAGVFTNWSKSPWKQESDVAGMPQVPPQGTEGAWHRRVRWSSKGKVMLTKFVTNGKEGADFSLLLLLQFLDSKRSIWYKKVICITPGHNSRRRWTGWDISSTVSSKTQNLSFAWKKNHQLAVQGLGEKVQMPQGLGKNLLFQFFLQILYFLTIIHNWESLDFVCFDSFSWNIYFFYCFPLSPFLLFFFVF